MQDEPVPVAERDVDREPHAERVHLPARPAHHHSLELAATGQAAPALSAGDGDFGVLVMLRDVTEQHGAERRQAGWHWSPPSGGAPPTRWPTPAGCPQVY